MSKLERKRKLFLIECDNAFFTMHAWSTKQNERGSFKCDEIVASGIETDELFRALEPKLFNRPEVCEECGRLYTESKEECECVSKMLKDSASV